MAKHIHIHVGKKKVKDVGEGPAPIRKAAETALKEAESICQRLKDGISGQGVSLVSLGNAINRGDRLLTNLKSLKSEIEHARDL